MELDGSTLVAPPPFVEVEIVYEPGRPGMTGRGWCALQVWTKNRVYDVEWSMRCFRVQDRETERPVPDHPLLGAKLTGGRKQDDEGGLELTYPLPRPGVCAVFEKGEDPPEYVSTSEVTRVVLRLRSLSVAEQAEEPSWQELSGSFRAVGTRPGWDDSRDDSPR